MEDTARESGGGRVRSPFLAALAAVLLLQSAWALALPMFRGPDEIEHLLRASNVALGQWVPEDRPADEDPRLVRAHAWLAAEVLPTCLVQREDFDPSVCRPTGTAADGTVEIRSVAANYNPVLYAVIGLPLRLTSGDAAVWLVRGTCALLSAAMIAWAWALSCGRRRTRWPAAAFLVAATPAVLFATTVVAPNGLGFAAGLLLWSALLAARRDDVGNAGPAAAAVSGSVLVLAHSTGVVWLGGIVLTTLALVGLQGTRHVLARRPRAWTASAVTVLLATGAAVAWTLLLAPNAPTAGEPLVAETKAIPMPAHVVLWVFQTIGVMPNRFGILWPVVYVLWLAPLALLLIRGVRAGGRRDRAGLVVAAVIAALVPVVATVMTYDAIGVGWQGRYELPLLVGILLMVGDVLDRKEPDVPPLLLAGGPILLAGTQYACLLCLGLRESTGPFSDDRPWTLLLAAVAPVLILASYFLLLGPQRGRVSVETQ